MVKEKSWKTEISQSETHLSLYNELEVKNEVAIAQIEMRGNTRSIINNQSLSVGFKHLRIEIPGGPLMIMGGDLISCDAVIGIGNSRIAGSKSLTRNISTFM